MTEKVERVVRLIREGVTVKWPPGHVELALLELARRRQRRLAARIGAGVGVGGVALILFGLGAHGYRLPQVSLRRAEPSRPAAAVKATTGAALPGPAPGLAATGRPRDGAAPRLAPASAPAADATPAARPGHLLQQRLVPRRQVAAARWVALAGQKRFGEAYGLLRQVPLRELGEPDDLLLAADVARQAGRADMAVPFLERVVKEHPHELCAQLAGFSLGKILLDNLEQPAAAAQRFAAVRALAPRGGLAQDALAREVEAWSRAGQAPRAQAAAQEYVHLYPTGRRLAAVRDLGGI